MTTSGDGATVVCSAQPLRVLSGTGRYFLGNVVAWPRARPTNGSDRGKRDLTLFVGRSRYAEQRRPGFPRCNLHGHVVNSGGLIVQFIITEGSPP